MKKMKVLMPLSFLILFGITGLQAQNPPPLFTFGLNQEEGIWYVTATFTPQEGTYQALQREYFGLELANPPQGVSLGETVYGPPDGEKLGLPVFTGPTELRAPLLPTSGLSPGPKNLNIIGKYQLCDAETSACFLPQREPRTLSWAGIDRVDPTPEAPGPRAGIDPGKLALMLLLALLGGLILNVMPCVLPVLSIKALSLVKQANEDKRTILHHGLGYTAGVIVSLEALALTAVLLRAAGTQAGWGFQLQNPGFVVFLLSVIWVFALSLLGVFEVPAPRWTGKAGGSSGSFLTGILAVFLATPCTAPFLGSALGFAFSQPSGVIFLIFFAVALGLSLPFLLLALMPSLIQRLPKPGPWMTGFQGAMGFLLAGTGIWLLDVLAYQIPKPLFTGVLVHLGLLGLAAWILGRWGTPVQKKSRRRTARILALILAGGSVLYLGSSFRTQERTAEEATGLPLPSPAWSPLNLEDLDLLKNGPNPAFIAVSAKWCLTCRTNETLVLKTETVETFFRDNGISLHYGDYTAKDPKLGRFIEAQGRAGVPLYLFFPGRGEDPVLLPEILTSELILNLI